jgi:3'-phosphoadenosine 5'-phosphosulfate sulfotransferase (PAPS reductase)/FAD synthetase
VKELKHIVSFSGGKDSTAMLLMMIEKGMPIDEIIFCDTGMEFPEMYHHIEKVERYIGRSITVLKGKNTFEYYLIYHKKKSNYNATGHGFPRMKSRWCTGILKEEPFNKYIKKFGEVKRYIGIAYDERHRVKQYDYPLVEWGITEAEALKYCYSKGFDWGGLYKVFNRVSCWCCPLQSLRELKNLYRYYPMLWHQLKEWESKAYNNFRCDYTIEELEERFNNEIWYEKHQLTMFKD